MVSNPDFDPNDPGSIFRPNRSHDYVSPHIQVSFPVSVTTNFRLSYAHQVQAPDFGLILRRSTNDFGLSGGVFGSDLDFSRSITLEFGIRHAFSDDMVLDLAAYNKDNLANSTGRTFPVHDPVKGGNSDIQRLTTADFGNVRGIDIRLDRRIGRWYNGMLGYSYNDAKNTGDDPFSYLNRASLIVSSLTGNSPLPAQAAFATRNSRPHNLSAAMDARNLFNFRNIHTVFSAFNDITSRAEHGNTWSADSADFAAEGIASGVRDSLGSIDLRFGGAVASGCAGWRSQGDEPLIPNCVYLIRAEERYGNGDHVFDLTEQRRASDAAYLSRRGTHAFTGTPRRLRVGVEISF